jgi:Domain of unknown function (DUF4397)
MKNSKNIFFSIMASFVMLSIFAACGSDDYDAALPESARIRFYHGVSDAPGVQISVNGTLLGLTKTLTLANGTSRIVNDSINYRLSSPADSTYLSFSPGEKSIALAPIGGTSALLEAKATLESGKSYSVFAVDSLAKVGALVVPDVFDPPVNKKASFRFVHLIPNAPAVDVIRVRGGTDTTVLFSNVVYRTSTAFASVDTSVGTTGAFKTDYLVRLSSTKATVSAASWTAGVFANGRIYTLVATGFVGGTGTKVVNKSLVTNSR